MDRNTHTHTHTHAHTHTHTHTHTHIYIYIYIYILVKYATFCAEEALRVNSNLDIRVCDQQGICYAINGGNSYKIRLAPFWKHIFSMKRRRLFKMDLVCRNANRKSQQKNLPLKIAEILPYVSGPLNANIIWATAQQLVQDCVFAQRRLRLACTRSDQSIRYPQSALWILMLVWVDAQAALSLRWSQVESYRKLCAPVYIGGHTVYTCVFPRSYLNLSGMSCDIVLPFWSSESPLITDVAENHDKWAR